MYPYRWAIGAGVLMALAAFLAFGFWKEWHLIVWRRRKLVAITATPVLLLTLWLGWSLGSPLFTNKTVEEEFPFAFTASLPPNLEMEEVEEIMAGLAKVDQPVDEAMPSPPSSLEEVMIDKALAMMKDAVEGSDQAMMDESLEMLADGVAQIKAGGAEIVPRTTDALTAVALKSGEFMDADAFHRGSGLATIYRGADGNLLLRLENLDVTNGPDLHVILSPHPNPENPSEVKTAGYVDLGKLKGNRGNQNYSIPEDVDITVHNSVIIYCSPFNVVFSVAILGETS